MNWMMPSLLRHCIGPLAVQQKCEAVQPAKWMMHWTPIHWNNKPVAFQFLPGSWITHSCSAHFRKPYFPMWSISNVLCGGFLVKLQKESSESAWKVQTITAIFMEIWLFITEVCHNPKSQQSLSYLLRLPGWETGQKLGPRTYAAILG